MPPIFSSRTDLSAFGTSDAADPDARSAIATEPTLMRFLRRDIALVIAIKVFLITVLYVLFFSPSDRPDPDSADVAERLVPSGQTP